MNVVERLMSLPPSSRWLLIKKLKIDVLFAPTSNLIKLLRKISSIENKFTWKTVVTVDMFINFYTYSKIFFALVNEETLLKTSQAFLVLSRIKRMELMSWRIILTRKTWHFSNNKSHENLCNTLQKKKDYFVGKFINIQDQNFHKVF